MRSIEHGNWLDEETAREMAEKEAFLVPTTVTYAALKTGGEAAGMPAALVAKVADAVERGLEALRVARKAGVRMAFGSDLLGPLHSHQSEEFALRAEAGLVPEELIEHATSNCGDLFALARESLDLPVGRIKEGHSADLVLLSSDPSDPETGAMALAAPERHVRLVVKEGLVAAAPGCDGAGCEGGAGGALAGVNARLVRRR